MSLLFGSCDCMTRPSSLSRRALLCAGGAGFVSALVGTMIGSGRTARAKALSEAIPEVDRLSVPLSTISSFADMGHRKSLMD
jgi:7,8-dihydropterin-6-yl-methyl-4-(beta-D-ribofuranosyl)aminobenzene 5'-phosphate synthase